MSSYANKFLMAYGEEAIINRPTPINTKVSIKRSTRSSRDLGARESYWEGIISYDVSLLSGEIITIRNSPFLVQSVNHDPASGETAFFCAKCNAILCHKRIVETVDEDFHIITSWQTIKNDMPAFENIETYRLRQTPTGLLDSTKYVFQTSKAFDVQMLDRLVYNGKNYKPVSINDSLSGIVEIQAAFDERAD